MKPDEPSLHTILRSIHRCKSFDDLSGVALAIDNAKLSDEERRVALDTLAGRRKYLARAAVTL